MGNASIPLAKPFTPKKIEFPALVSTKFDGVPIRFNIDNGVVHEGYSRQHEVFQSVQHFRPLLERVLPYCTGTVVGEVTHPTVKDFKDLSGLVRRQQPCDDLILNIFDGYIDNMQDQPFIDRWDRLVGAADEFIDQCWFVANVRVHSHENLADLIRALEVEEPDAEGWVLRCGPDGFMPNKRSWGYQKIVFDPTIELKIVNFEEAVSQTGEKLGMVGGLIAEYKGTRIGVGPGKLTHEERRSIWQHWISEPFMPHYGIATIKYKRDPSYDALRQPTFQHWRHDKTEADA